MSYFDRSHFDGQYEVGNPQLQVIVPPKDQFKLYPYQVDNSVLNHVKQAGTFLITLEPLTNLPVHSQTMTGFVANAVLRVVALPSKQFERASQVAKVKCKQLGFWEPKGVLGDSHHLGTYLEPPFRFDISLFGTEEEPWAQFRNYD